MEEWEQRWRDKATEPYTVVHIEPRYPNIPRAYAREWWSVYYRCYSKRSYIEVQAQDELGAYMEALKHLKVNKRKTDQLHKKNQQGANQ